VLSPARSSGVACGSGRFLLRSLADGFTMHSLLKGVLIAQYWVTDTPPGQRSFGRAAPTRGSTSNPHPDDHAAGHRDHVANTLPPMLLGTVLVSWADRWPSVTVMGRFQMPQPRGLESASWLPWPSILALSVR